MEKLWQDIRYGLRKLRKSPAFTLAAILSLAIGIGANTTIFSIINILFLKGLAVKEPERLVAVYGTDEKNNGDRFDFMPISYPNYEDYQKQNNVMDRLVYVNPNSHQLNLG